MSSIAAFQFTVLFHAHSTMWRLFTRNPVQCMEKWSLCLILWAPVASGVRKFTWFLIIIPFDFDCRKTSVLRCTMRKITLHRWRNSVVELLAAAPPMAVKPNPFTTLARRKQMPMLAQQPCPPNNNHHRRRRRCRSTSAFVIFCFICFFFSIIFSLLPSHHHEPNNIDELKK